MRAMKTSIIVWVLIGSIYIVLSRHPSNGTAMTVLGRTKRQTSLLCIGSGFVHEVLTTIFDRNRDTIRNAEPNVIGTCQHFGLFRLCKARAWRLYTTLIPEQIKVSCDDTDTWAQFDITIAVQDLTVHADVTFPLSLAGCILRAEWRLLTARVIAYWPTSRTRTGFSPKVDEVTLTSHEGLTFGILGGAYPLTTALGVFFSFLQAVYPYFVDSLLALILKTALQQWIDGYYEELPF